MPTKSEHPLPSDGRLEALASLELGPEDEQRDERAMAKEILRLREVIKIGGAMYRMERASMAIPGGHDPNQKGPSWGVNVKALEGSFGYKTVFSVGAQSFTLAESDEDKPQGEALEHCSFIGRSFLCALENMGVNISTRDSNL